MVADEYELQVVVGLRAEYRACMSHVSTETCKLSRAATSGSIRCDEGMPLTQQVKCASSSGTWADTRPVNWQRRTCSMQPSSLRRVSCAGASSTSALPARSSGRISHGASAGPALAAWDSGRLGSKEKGVGLAEQQQDAHQEGLAIFLNMCARVCRLRRFLQIELILLKYESQTPEAST